MEEALSGDEREKGEPHPGGLLLDGLAIETRQVLVNRHRLVLDSVERSNLLGIERLGDDLSGGFLLDHPT